MPTELNMAPDITSRQNAREAALAGLVLSSWGVQS